MDNQILLNHIKHYAEKQGYSCDDSEEYLEILQDCGKDLYSRNVGDRRWWKDVFRVTELDGKEIGYMDAETTGDSSPSDLGWKFNLSSICEVERREETNVVVTYSKKE